MASIADKRRTYRTLHERGCFVLPNPWDVGTAQYLQQLGFAALATTSAGYAFSRGLPDNKVSRDAMLAHIAELVGATDVPVNADFEGGLRTLARRRGRERCAVRRHGCGRPVHRGFNWRCGQSTV